MDKPTVYAGSRLGMLIITSTVKKLYEVMTQALGCREKTVLRMRYGLCGGAEKTQREIADVLGISRSYVYKPTYYKRMESQSTIRPSRKPYIRPVPQPLRDT